MEGNFIWSGAILIGLLVATVIGLLTLWIVSQRRWRRERDELNVAMAKVNEARSTAEAKIQFYADRFRPVTNMDDEIGRLNGELETVIAKLKIAKQFSDQKLEELRADYAAKKATYDALVKEIAIFDERLAFAEMGVYEPHFDFGDSEQYKTAIAANRAEQKALISVKSAVLCLEQWTVNGSRADGKRMSDRNIKLTLRAFNSECDAAIANCRWNNVNAMEKRIEKAQQQIDKLNEANSIVITSEFLALKLKELYLTHEYREKLREEREERAEAARLAREEQKLQRDIERAEEEEARYERLLNKAKAEAQSIVGPQLAVFQEQISVLERDLAEAHEKTLRAQALAERTKSGYVYVISNIGSFGEGIVKIGLTRRLDPTDRIRELGDASVPFIFDTHALIYSDDAPSLERALHAEFEGERINASNMRKEFFRASIDEVERALKRLAPSAPFFKDIEAQEFRETQAKRNAALMSSAPTRIALPETL